MGMNILLKIILFCFLTLSLSVADTSNKTHFIITQVVKGPLGEKGKSILKKAYSKLGYTVEFKFLPSERALLSTNKGLTDGEMFRIKGIDSKYKNLVPIPIPYMSADNVLFVNKAWDKDIKSWEDLKSIIKSEYDLALRIGLKKAENQLNKLNIPYVGVPSTINAIKMLSDGKVKIVYEDKLTGLESIKNQDITNVKYLEPPFDKVLMYHYIHESNAFLVPELTKVLNNMRE